MPAITSTRWQRLCSGGPFHYREAGVQRANLYVTQRTIVGTYTLTQSYHINSGLILYPCVLLPYTNPFSNRPYATIDSTELIYQLTCQSSLYLSVQSQSFSGSNRPSARRTTTILSSLATLEITLHDRRHLPIQKLEC